jgi:hypothetical protein
MSEPEDLKEKRIAELASRKSGIIPISDFLNENECFYKTRIALRSALEEGLFYYLDDITREKFLSMHYVGKKSWYMLLDAIDEALEKGKYLDNKEQIKKHFKANDRYSKYFLQFK